MFSKRVAAVLTGLCCCLVTSLSQAQCSKDTDCKGDRVCEGGACVTPKATPPAALAAPEGAATGSAPAAAPPAAAAPPPAAAPAPPYEEPRNPSVPDDKPRMQRHSSGMMAGGIVMVSFAPIALLVVMVANIEQKACENGTYYSGSRDAPGINCGRFDPTIYGGLVTAAALVGVGIPMIVIGGKKEPVGTASLAPWASPHGAGLGLRFDL
ncbi:MAG: hypothetical protein ABUL60_14285 [Myxococcales bacterium]